MGFTVAKFGAVPTSERSDAGFQQRLKAPLGCIGVRQASVLVDQGWDVFVQRRVEAVVVGSEFGVGAVPSQRFGRKAG